MNSQITYATIAERRRTFYNLIRPDPLQTVAEWANELGQTIRTVRQEELYEISLVPEPAYERTSVALRAVLDAVIAAELVARRRRLDAQMR